MNKNKGVFLDRDGVINQEMGEYTYQKEHFFIIDGVKEALQKFKAKGYFLIIITNQAGLNKGIYTRKDMEICHQYMMEQLDNLIDAIYYSPYHPSITASLVRKPGTLLFEKAIHKFKINPNQSWMIGDREKDILPALQLGMGTVRIGSEQVETQAQFISPDLKSASDKILHLNR